MGSLPWRSSVLRARAKLLATRKHKPEVAQPKVGEKVKAAGGSKKEVGETAAFKEQDAV